jgi:serine/threonine protein kinase
MKRFIAVIEQAIGHAQACYVYREQAKFVSSTLTSISEFLRSPSFNVNIPASTPFLQARDSIQFYFEKIDRILQLLTRSVWPLVALDDKENLISDDLSDQMRGLVRLLSSALASPFEYNFPVAALVLDLQLRYSIFKSSTLNDPRIARRIESLEAALRANKGSVSVLPNTPKDILIVAQGEVDPSVFGHKQVIYSATPAGTLMKCDLSGAEQLAYQLNIIPSDDIGHDRAGSECLVAASVNHPAILPVVGFCAAKNSPVVVAYPFSPGAKTLADFLRISERKDSDLTAIAYEIAHALYYLHSRRIVHRNLTSGTVFIGDDMSPRLLGVGLTFPNDATFAKFMPPEFLEFQIFTTRSDVYCYGLLLWEILTKLSPFSDVPEGGFKNVVALQGQRPEIPYDTPDRIRKLITACWAADPYDRPSFVKIIRLFENGKTYFGDTKPDLTALIEAYCKKSSGTAEETEVIAAFSKPSTVGDVLRSFIEKESRRLLIPNLLGKRLIEHLTSVLTSIAPTILIPFLTELFVDRANLFAFADCGGFKQLRQLLKSNQAVIDPIVTAASPHRGRLGVRYTRKLAPVLIEARRFDGLREILDGNAVTSLTLSPDHIEILTREIATPAAALILVAALSSRAAVAKFLAPRAFIDVLRLGSIDLVRRLREYPAFLELFEAQHLNPLIEILIKESGRVRDTVAFFILGLGREILQVFSGNPQFLKAVIAIDDISVRSRFIVRLCQFPLGAEFFIGQPQLFENGFTDPWLLAALSRIAGFFPSEVAALGFLVPSILANLRETRALEATLRLVGTLSQTPQLWESRELIAVLFAVIESDRCDPLALTLVLAILENVAQTVSLDAYFMRILSLAERGDKDTAALALRVLGRLNLPFGDEKLIGRILAVAVRNLEGGTKQTGTPAAGLLERFDPENVRERKLEQLVVKAADAESNPARFYALVSLLDHLDVVVPKALITKFDSILADGVAGKASASIIRTRDSLEGKSFC